jgi:thymidylate synthase
MAHTDKTYKTLCTKINTEGRLYKDKSRNVSRIQITGHTLRHNFSNGFPALSAKQLPYKFVKENWYGSLEETHISSTC